ncbi:MAG: CZB domain-containing protein, partial [Hydrogenobaculum sp.]
MRKLIDAAHQHEIYVYNFRNLINKEMDWDPPQYTQCNFGKIYYSLDDKYILNTYGETAHRIFKRLGDNHRDFHQIAESCLSYENEYELKLLITELASKSSMLVDTMVSLVSSGLVSKSIDKYTKLFSMKLSDWAKKKGVSYKTAWRWFKQGLIKGYQMPTGTIIVEDEPRKETKE